MTVVMQGIVRTEVRPPQTRRWLRYRPLSRFRGATPTQRGDPAPVEASQFRQLGHEHGGYDRAHAGHAAQQFGLVLPSGVVPQAVVEDPVEGLQLGLQPLQVGPEVGVGQGPPCGPAAVRPGGRSWRAGPGRGRTRGPGAG